MIHAVAYILLSMETTELKTTRALLATRYRRWLAAPWKLHIAAAVVAVLAQQLAQLWLNSWYAASGYPVPYYVGQLSFSADKLEHWYAVMSDRGTLGTYVTTQFVDFVFIAATAAAHLFVLSLIAKGLRGKLRAVAVGFVAVGLAAPLFDVMENLVSFVMLANPQHIASVLAVIYSCFAAAKFACFAVVYLWAPIGLVALVAPRLRRSSVQQPMPMASAH